MQPRFRHVDVGDAVLALFLSGTAKRLPFCASYPQDIATHLGCSVGTVHKLLRETYDTDRDNGGSKLLRSRIERVHGFRNSTWYLPTRPWLGELLNLARAQLAGAADPIPDIPPT